MPMPVGPVHNGSGGHCHGQSAVPCNYKASGVGVPMEGEVGLFREAGSGAGVFITIGCTAGSLTACRL